MKKIYNIICSAICSLFVLAVAGCDLELREDPLGDAGETLNETVSSLPYSIDGISNASSKITFEKGVITEETGVAFSFNIDGSYSNDWTAVLKVNGSEFGLSTIGYFDGNNANKFMGHLYESEGTATNGYSYSSFYNTTGFATISVNTDGSIQYYKDGVLGLTYASDTSLKKSEADCTVKDMADFVIASLNKGNAITTNIIMKNLKNI